MTPLSVVMVGVEDAGCRYIVIVVVWLSFVILVERECCRTCQPAGAHPGLTTGSHSGVYSVLRLIVKASSEFWWGEGNGHFHRILTTGPSSHFGDFVLSVTRKKTVFLQLQD
jgi:hypothetical protein